jgi:hypothetical protein
MPPASVAVATNAASANENFDRFFDMFRATSPRSIDETVSEVFAHRMPQRFSYLKAVRKF